MLAALLFLGLAAGIAGIAILRVLAGQRRLGKAEEQLTQAREALRAHESFEAVQSRALPSRDDLLKKMERRADG